MTEKSKNTEIVQVAESPQILDVLQMAMKDSDVDLAKMEKIMDLYERVENRNAEKSFYLAMNRLQANKPEMIKTKEVEYDSKKGGKVKYKFNPLAKIQKVIDPVLSKHGLSYKFRQDTKDGIIRITCVVSHVDGYSEETWMEGPKDDSGAKNALQAIGSTRSYLMRYTLENALGLSSDEDDDGKSSGDVPVIILTDDEIVARIESAESIDTLKVLFSQLTKDQRKDYKDRFGTRRLDIDNLNADLKMSENN